MRARVHVVSEDPGSFKSLPHEPLPLVALYPSHQQSLVNDNPNIYVALGRDDRGARGASREGGTWLALASAGVPPLTGPAAPEWRGPAIFGLGDGPMT